MRFTRFIVESIMNLKEEDEVIEPINVESQGAFIAGRECNEKSTDINEEEAFGVE